MILKPPDKIPGGRSITMYTVTKHFRRNLHHYNLLLIQMTIYRIPAITTFYLYVLFTFTLHFIFFSENKDIINMHTIFLTKYKMIIRKRSNIY